MGKDVSERTETVRDTVRHTQVDIEPITGQTAGSTGTAGDWDSDFRSNYQTQYVTTGDPYEYTLPRPLTNSALVMATIRNIAGEVSRMPKKGSGPITCATIQTVRGTAFVEQFGMDGRK